MQYEARSFGFDVLRCERCGGRRKLLALVEDPTAIRDILAHLGLADDPPTRAAPRGPPQVPLDLH